MQYGVHAPHIELLKQMPLFCDEKENPKANKVMANFLTPFL